MQRNRSLFERTEQIRNRVFEGPGHSEVVFAARGPADEDVIDVALDILEDCEKAILAYKRCRFPKSDGARYLYYYGLLQAMYVQQDALCELETALRMEFPGTVPAELQPVRRLRNALVGHPTNLGPKAREDEERSSCRILRLGMQKWTVEYQELHENKIEHQTADLRSAVGIQQQTVLQRLDAILVKVGQRIAQRSTDAKKADFVGRFRSMCSAPLDALQELLEGPELRTSSANLGRWRSVAKLEKCAGWVKGLFNSAQPRLKMESFDSLPSAFHELESVGRFAGDLLKGWDMQEVDLDQVDEPTTFHAAEVLVEELGALALELRRALCPAVARGALPGGIFSLPKHPGAFALEELSKKKRFETIGWPALLSYLADCDTAIQQQSLLGCTESDSWGHGLELLRHGANLAQGMRTGRHATLSELMPLVVSLAKRGMENACEALGHIGQDDDEEDGLGG